MLQVTFKKDSMNRVKQIMESIGANVRKELAVAVNATTKKAKIAAGRELGKILPVPIKILKKTVGQSRRANERRIEAVMTLREGYSFPLRFFKPKQTSAGVNVSFDKRIKGKKGKTFVKSAFIASTLGKKVMQRQGPKREMTKGRHKGKMRQPIEQLFGPSPGQAFIDADIAKLVMAVASKELSIQVQNRLRFLILKAQGGLKGKQK